MNKEINEHFQETLRKFTNELPIGSHEIDIYNNVSEIINLLKIKGLTVKEALLLFRICSEYILTDTLI